MPGWGGWSVFLHQTLLLVSVVVPAMTLAQTPSAAPVGSADALSASTNDTSKGSPWCQWVAQEALECHIRTLEDSLGSQVVKGHWQDRNDTSGIPAAGQWPRDQVPGLPGAWAARSDTRHLRVLSVECSQVLYYQSRLTARTFQGLENVEELAINNCKLDSLPPGTLSSLGRLRSLEVTTHNGEWAALAMEVVSGSLPLTLERVSLAHNNIWTLPPRAFCGPNSLHHLDLSHNRLQDVHELGFMDQVQLDILMMNMSNTSFSEHSAVFSNLDEVSSAEGCGQALRELILDHNDLVRLPDGSFRVLSGLRELHLRDNDIRLISSEAFSGLTALQVLYLSNNHIIALHNGTFSDNIALERLYLNNNSLSALNSKVFQDMKELQVLEISNNKLYLDNSHDDLFKGLRRLVILDLSWNSLTTITKLLFRDLTSLQRLVLSHNAIQSLEDDSFTSLSNLYALDLSHNLLLTLGEANLRGLVGLSLIHLANNSLFEIHPHAFRHSSNLKQVFLSHNHLQAIPKALENLSFIKTLDMSYNNIVSIQPFLFGGLGNLELLNVSHNKLDFISQGSFKGLVSVKDLDLRDNAIHTVNEGSFDGVPNVLNLVLARNQLSNIDHIFAGLEHLESLDLSENNIRMFDYAFIPQQLINLNLKNNKIGQLGNFFKVHTVLTLENIDASHNNIKSLTEFSLPNTIVHVILHHNNITRILPNSFRDKVNLQTLDLSMNSLQRINPKSVSMRVASGKHTSAQIYLSGNPLICDCEMEWLYNSFRSTLTTTPEATEVTFLQPRIDDLARVTCTLPHSREDTTVMTRVLETSAANYLCPYTTHCFTLCQCCDFIACDCQMKCPDACSCFHDDTWSMNLVDCSGGHLDRLPDRVPMDATVVLLDGNNLQILHAHHFIGRHSIQQLYLNNSQIQTLQNRTFHGLTSLRVLHLQDNMIVQLNGFEFSGLHHLKELYLQNNRLSFINNATFIGLKSLEILRLDNNFIIDFPVWLLSNNRYLASVTLGNNPWDCDCQFVESLREWQKQQSHLLINPEDVFCVHGDSGVVGPSIILPEYSCTEAQHGVTQYKFGQQELPFLAGGLCGGVALISALVVMAMLVARRRAAAANKLGINGSPAYCQEEDGKVFDSYISYSANDASFVRDVLATKLENSCPSYKLCLHSRDFSENSRLSEFITQSLGFSRRTIIVLSKNYIDNEWKNAIFKKAHVDGLKDSDMGIIAIYYDNVSYSSFDSDLKNIMRRCIKLRWGDKNFWKKLSEAMPIKQTYAGLPVYVSENSYKSSTLPTLIPPSSLPLPSSSSVLTSTTGLTTPSEIGHRTSCQQEPPATTYKAPPPPRPCYTPPSCDYIVMTGRDCRDPQCTCHRHSHAAYTYVDGDSSSLHTYTSLEPFTLPDPHVPESYTRGHSPASSHYSALEPPVRRTVRASKRKKKRPLSQNCPPVHCDTMENPAFTEDVHGELPSNGTFRRTKSLRASRGNQERHSDYSTDHSSDRSSGRSYDHSVTTGGGVVDRNDALYMGLADSPPEPTMVTTEECFV
ncbi:toll-like receptor Tollo [Penaeus monodon]|uniref:toll-like receptor Tollo n=1 Tax=Penaeus monodon TaxID=6687 RepID=UPI0018A707F0|nr:toll-like receptor Tollo [Penaeus monodon]